MIEELKLITRTSSGRLIKVPAAIERRDGRIYFVKSPFSLKDEIKAMKGSKWHGFEDEGDGPYSGKKVWSVEDCQRNGFQLSLLCGDDVFEWFDRELVRHEFRPLLRKGEPTAFMEHQKDLTDAGLTYHFQLWAAEMGTGKTLAAQLLIEMSGVHDWFWIGPKTSLPNIQREFRIWGFPAERFDIQYHTYEGLVRVIDEWPQGVPPPHGLICDESSRLKNATSQRSRAAQRLADMIRDKWGLENGYVIEMSGTPSPKTPIDWWSQCEIAWPGFLREGSARAMESRMAFMVDQKFETAAFKKRIGWKDDERKCDVCGDTREEGPHELDGLTDPAEYHPFKPSKNEVSYLYERLKGLVIIKHKKDCLHLPDKRYRQIVCKPNASTLRVAKSLMEAAPNAVTGMTLLRELSDGFQYRETKDGMTKCHHCTDGTVQEWFIPGDESRVFSNIDLLDDELVSQLEKRSVTCPVCGGKQEVDKIIRITREVPCPKDAALRMLLDECEETGRIVVFAGFTGSVDRVAKLVKKEGWSAVRCDQGNFNILPHDNEEAVTEEPLDYWANLEAHPRVAFVANPESGGMSLTLVESRMAVYWSNSWKPEFRVQSEDRIHRKGMDENLGCTIVDLIHLPSDRRVLEVIRANRKLELMTMGEVMNGVNWDDAATQEGEFEEYRT